MINRITNPLYLLLGLSLFATTLKAANIPTSKTTDHYRLETRVDDVSIPWGMVLLSDGSLLYSERKGAMYRIGADGKKKKIKGLPDIVAKGQGGLLDIHLHPDYANNGWIYYAYSSPEGKGRGSNTAIARAKLKNDQLTEQQVLYKASPNSTRGHHFGSRISFDKQGFLYFSIGDRGDRDTLPQDIKLDGGKIYRLHDDGRIPKDNPFVKDASAKKAIFSYGHRNPQGMAKHPQTGAIWTHEHGPRGGDEINVISKGLNYGWPVISYGINYNGTRFTDITHKEGMQQPLWHWTPSIAPSGMVFVTSERYPEWKGHLLVGSLKFGYLVLCKLEGNKVVSQEVVLDKLGRVRNIIEAADGYLYVATDNGKIARIIHTAP
ncbi:PQQ-dependent sugar dehydrogenase [Pleionea sp. CnH1-48]|uniref:PQQ-dependent sugar dehydrogenase n=1 Tax=Pleionea sp. CnH1-48 TaxID=2954494 RepID=UPI002097D6AB|nr:PQQ-dependent sugar dehydrogenase [Pleionea sp. CnH1-48]MCO7223485.1 PQQ-dependent sugar dehydrogenase [Pleionea sp. CnH1-48]